MRRVVVTGLGAMTPVGQDVPTMWKSLLAGVSGAGRIASFDASGFASQIAAEIHDFDPSRYLSQKELKRTERFVQFAVAASKQAFADSGIDLGREDPFRIGVLIGSGMGSLGLI